MKHYKQKKLIMGYLLKPDLRGMVLVGIPFKYSCMPIRVEYDNEYTIIDRNTPLLHKELQKDKFGKCKSGYFTLYYYEWKPNIRQLGLFS